MKRLRLAQVIFMVIAVIAAIPLTIEVFGDMTNAILYPSGIVILVCLLGNAVCAVAAVDRDK